jgi:hypothetical protein
MRVAAQGDYGIAGLDIALAGDGEVEVESSLEELGHELLARHLDPSLKQGRRGWVTTSSAVPNRKRSPC